MILRIYKSNTPSKRHYINVIFNYTVKKPILKFKLKKQIKLSGRGNLGKITIFNRGGHHKRRYRLLLNISNINYKGIIFSIEYDPNRNCCIASVYNYKNNTFFYTIAPNKLKIGDCIKSKEEALLNLGHVLTLKNIPLGCPIFNVASKYAKSAGCFAVILNKTNNNAQLILSSGKQKNINLNNLSIIGSVSNEYFFLKQLGKAGKKRWLGFKPKVKGICMNPVDHPNGGGEGKSSSKRKSPWGKIIRSKK